jgi:hypothetical protein
VYARRQWKVMSGQLTEMQASGAQTQELIKQQTEQAAATNRLADNVLASDRPWIGLTQFRITGFEPNKDLTVTLSIINAGKSPADIALEELGVGEFKTFPPNPLYVKTKTKPSHTLAVPGTIVIQQKTFRVDSSAFNRIASGRTMYFIYAHVDYRDVRTNQVHYAHICQMYMPDFKDFFICNAYNDAN